MQGNEWLERRGGCGRDKGLVKESSREPPKGSKLE